MSATRAAADRDLRFPPHDGRLAARHRRVRRMNEHNQSGRMAARQRADAPPRRDHHGRQRPLGRAAAGCRARPGHRMGVEAVRRTVRAAIELGVQYLTIYSFSSENWSRPASEIDDLMGLMQRFIRRDLAELHQNGVRIGVIGERDRRGRGAARADRRGRGADQRQSRAQPGDRLQLRLAGRDRQGGAAAGGAALEGAITPQDITPEALSAALDTQGVPDPDLLIRTSGELRLSNFLLWQSAYTEFVFLDAFWPDFGRELLEQAIDEFRRRSRRFGGVVARSTG